MAHSHAGHREHQVAHRRVHHILKHEPDGAKHHSRSHAFSKVTSKTAAEKHDVHVSGKKAPKRYARGGKVKRGAGGDVPTSGGRSRFDALERIGKGYQPPPPPKQPQQPEPQERARGGKAKHYARGGKVKKGGHQTNIIIAMPHRGSAGASPVPPAGAPPIPPPAGGAPVPMPMRGGPPMPPPGMPMRKRGGKITAGAESGVGRLQKAHRSK